MLAALMNLGFAGGGTAAVVTEFGDLTTLWAAYVDTLKDAHVAALDVTTLVANDVDAMRTGNTNLDDANTAYASYLS